MLQVEAKLAIYSKGVSFESSWTRFLVWGIVRNFLHEEKTLQSSYNSILTLVNLLASTEK